jgi:hypothetical protein
MEGTASSVPEFGVNVAILVNGPQVNRENLGQILMAGRK